jgi:hypothetical protein
MRTSMGIRKQPRGFVFTDEGLAEVRGTLLAEKVPVAAQAGAIVPCASPEH